MGGKSAAEGIRLTPPPEGFCPECSAPHTKADPHDAGQLFYQVKFKAEHGRHATWADAWAHCTPQLQGAWRAALAASGLPIDPKEKTDGKASGKAGAEGGRKAGDKGAEALGRPPRGRKHRASRKRR